MIETKNDTYIDDLVVKTDYTIPRYFRDIFNQNSDIFGRLNMKICFKIYITKIIKNKNVVRVILYLELLLELLFLQL